MSDEGETAGTRANLYVRSLVPESYNQRQSEIIQRVGRLVDQGVFTKRYVRPCGRQLPATPTEADTRTGEWLLKRFRAFREWATANDCDITPAFEIQEVECSITESQYRAMRPPAVLLAEYRDGELVCVTPHCDGETVQTVCNRLSELEAGTSTPYEPVADATAGEPTEPVIRQ